MCPLSILYSRSLDTGCPPDGWMKGHVTSVYKRGGHSSANNYQPITLTSVVGKILESIIRDHVLDHLIKHTFSFPSTPWACPHDVMCSQSVTAMDHWMQAFVQQWLQY